MKGKLKRQNKGITLVALVVTIVVLLILAGITITYVFGDNSVFRQASEAKLKTDIANWQERLEMAKSPIFIEGIGTFDPNKYFDYIQGQGIINSKDTDVIDNKDGTYDVTTKPGYVFLITLTPTPEKPTDAEIEYIGQAGKLSPKIRKIMVIDKTKESIDIQILARLEGGEIKCYYKKTSEVGENEEQNNIDGYTTVSLDENLVGSITGLIAGETYKIKAVIRKNEEDIQWVSIQEKTLPLVTVTSIILNKETAKLVEEETLQLTAIVKPDNAEDKTVTWSSSNTSVAKVTQKGLVTGVAAGTATITVTAKDGSKISTSCTITVTNIWEKLNKVAKAISNDNQITSSSTQATGKTEEGEEYNIKIGDIFNVKYNGTTKQVRVIGFKHDDLVDQSVYGGTNAKAGITFDFVYFMTGTTYMSLNSSATNSGGWANTQIRKSLNGYTNNSAEQSGTIGGLGNYLSNKQYIKQVKKSYIPTYKVASTSICNDYLWLLSCGEIFSSGFKAGYAAYTITKEGKQYQWYKSVETAWNSANANLGKKATSTSEEKGWWLRSPAYNDSQSFAFIQTNGYRYAKIGG